MSSSPTFDLGHGTYIRTSPKWSRSPVLCNFEVSQATFTGSHNSIDMNPFTQGGWGSGSGIAPSIFGALPTLPVSDSIPRSMQPDSVTFQLTNFNTTILNCSILGPQSRVAYRVVTDSGAPSSTIFKDNESRNVAMIQWQPNATLEIRGVTSRQRARDWLRLASDQRLAHYFL